MNSATIPKHITSFLLILCGCGLFASCKKFIEVDPPMTGLTGGSTFASDATAAAVMTGLYTNVSGTTKTSANKLRFLSWYAGMSSDELTLWKGVSDNRGVLYYRNALVSNASLSVGGEFWTSIFPYTYVCNSVLEGLNNSTGVTPAVKDKLTGEALFMRSFLYYYLINLYGDVPFVTGTDYEQNRKLARTGRNEILLQLISDTKEAKAKLSDTYLDGTLANTVADRVRPVKAAASALLARLYLLNEEWANAEAEATIVINNPIYKLEPVLNNVFKNTSQESIWSLQPVRNGYNTEDAQLYILPAAGPTVNFTGNPVYLSKYLMAAFDSGDRRKYDWVDSVVVGGKDTFYYSHKYKIKTINTPVSEYTNVFRLAELYLIRAEARAKLDKLTGANSAQSDIDAVRLRAGLKGTTATTKNDLLSAVLHERQVELFTEWGHRWLDLKRTKTVDAVMQTVTAQKGGTWDTRWQWYPVPYSELIASTYLKQNGGY